MHHTRHPPPCQSARLWSPWQPPSAQPVTLEERGIRSLLQPALPPAGWVLQLREEAAASWGRGAAPASSGLPLHGAHGALPGSPLAPPPPPNARTPQSWGEGWAPRPTSTWLLLQPGASPCLGWDGVGCPRHKCWLGPRAVVSSEGTGAGVASRGPSRHSPRLEGTRDGLPCPCLLDSPGRWPGNGGLWAGRSGHTGEAGILRLLRFPQLCLEPLGLAAKGALAASASQGVGPAHHGSGAVLGPGAQWRLLPCVFLSLHPPLTSRHPQPDADSRAGACFILEASLAHLQVI